MVGRHGGRDAVAKAEGGCGLHAGGEKACLPRPPGTEVVLLGGIWTTRGAQERESRIGSGNGVGVRVCRTFATILGSRLVPRTFTIVGRRE